MTAPREASAQEWASPQEFRRIIEACQPVILRGLVRDWPVVRAAAAPAGLRDYLARFDRGGQADVFFGDPHIGGRYYYGENLKGFNFERRQIAFLPALDAILASATTPGAQSVYLGSLPLPAFLPGFEAENPLTVLPGVLGRIWLGTASVVSAHYDAVDNIACVIAGRRRFTLYPPQAIGNLYVGPIDHTMAGQPVGLAVGSEPGDPRYPRFEQIRDQALVADLEPGDALYLPKLWWHQVESTAPFNGLVNYWWDAFAAGPDAPFTSLLLSMATIAERPLPERLAWRALFDHYVFRPERHPLEHLPPEQHGILGPLRDNYRRIRVLVMRKLRGE